MMYHLVSKGTSTTLVLTFKISQGGSSMVMNSKDEDETPWMCEVHLETKSSLRLFNWNDLLKRWVRGELTVN